MNPTHKKIAEAIKKHFAKGREIYPFDSVVANFTEEIADIYEEEDKAYEEKGEKYIPVNKSFNKTQFLKTAGAEG